MRTTVTLESDVEALLRQSMRRRGVSFKEALNDAVRDGLTARGSAQPFVVKTFPLGTPTVPLTKALAVAADLEDDELTRRLAVRK